MTISYTGYKKNLEVTIGWRELEVVLDAIKEYEEKWKEFDETTQNTFDTLKEVLKENEAYQ